MDQPSVTADGKRLHSEEPRPRAVCIVLICKTTEGGSPPREVHASLDEGPEQATALGLIEGLVPRMSPDGAWVLLSVNAKGERFLNTSSADEDPNNGRNA
jgi:hypothetical protein